MHTAIYPDWVSAYFSHVESGEPEFVVMGISVYSHNKSFRCSMAKVLVWGWVLRSELFSWIEGWDKESGMADAALVIYFAAPALIRNNNVAEILRQRYPQARQIGCSSGGEIALHNLTGNCQLHNQTMTITTMWED